MGRNLNKTSLILYSGPSQPLYTQTFDHTFWTERSIGNATSSTFSSPILTYNYPYQAGWLGCGDAPLSSATNLSKFDSLFGDYKLFASTFSPPHHGSLRDWNIQLLDSFGYPNEISPVCVISADGLHQHPRSIRNIRYLQQWINTIHRDNRHTITSYRDDDYECILQFTIGLKQQTLTLSHPCTSHPISTHTNGHYATNNNQQLYKNSPQNQTRPND